MHKCHLCMNWELKTSRITHCKSCTKGSKFEADEDITFLNELIMLADGKVNLEEFGKLVEKKFDMLVEEGKCL